MSTPTEEQLNPFPGDLDGRVVVENLLGKSIEDAAALLARNSLRFQEDYTWMGAEAFCFYASALVKYLQSDASSGDYAFAYGMLGTFQIRLEQEGLGIAPAFPVIEAFCETIEKEFARLGFNENYTKRARRRLSLVESKMAELRNR